MDGENMANVSGDNEINIKKGHGAGKFRLNLKTVIAIIILAIMASIIVTGVFLGRLYIGIKTPEQDVLLMSNVCQPNGLIGKFREIQDKNVEAVGVYTELANEVKAFKSYEYDPNCLYILAYDAATINDESALDNYIVNIVSLDENGIRVSKELYSKVSYDQLKNVRKMLFDLNTGSDNLRDGSSDIN